MGVKCLFYKCKETNVIDSDILCLNASVDAGGDNVCPSVGSGS